MSNPLITRTFFRLSQGVCRGQILPLTNPGFCLWGNHFQHWLIVSQSRVHWAEPPWCQEQAIKGKFTSGLRLTVHGESFSDHFLLRIFKVGIMTMKTMMNCHKTAVENRSCHRTQNCPHEPPTLQSERVQPVRAYCLLSLASEQDTVLSEDLFLAFHLALK